MRDDDGKIEEKRKELTEAIQALGMKMEQDQVERMVCKNGDRDIDRPPTAEEPDASSESAYESTGIKKQWTYAEAATQTNNESTVRRPP